MMIRQWYSFRCSIRVVRCKHNINESNQQQHDNNDFQIVVSGYIREYRNSWTLQECSSICVLCKEKVWTWHWYCTNNRICNKYVESREWIYEDEIRRCFCESNMLNNENETEYLPLTSCFGVSVIDSVNGKSRPYMYTVPECSQEVIQYAAAPPQCPSVRVLTWARLWCEYGVWSTNTS